MPADAHQTSVETLADQVLRRTGWAEDVTTLWPALSLYRRVRPTPEAPCLYQPNVTLVLSGQKRVMLAEEQFVMTPGQFGPTRYGTFLPAMRAENTTVLPSGLKATATTAS